MSKELIQQLKDFEIHNMCMGQYQVAELIEKAYKRIEQLEKNIESKELNREESK